MKIFITLISLLVISDVSGKFSDEPLATPPGDQSDEIEGLKNLVLEMQGEISGLKSEMKFLKRDFRRAKRDIEMNQIQYERLENESISVKLKLLDFQHELRIESEQRQAVDERLRDEITNRVALQDRFDLMESKQDSFEQQLAEEASQRIRLEGRLGEEVAKREVLEERVNEIISDVEDVNYEELHSRYTEVQRVNVDHYAERLMKKGAELWVSSETSLAVYTHDLTLVKRVELEDVRYAESVVPDPSGEYIMVANRGWGYRGNLRLHHTNGSYIRILENGSYYDLISHEDKVYSLTYKPDQNKCQISVFGLDESRNVILEDVIPFRYGDRIVVYNDTIYLTDVMNHHFRWYNMSGQFLGEAGEFGKDIEGVQPGLLFSPELCNADDHGNMLVADMLNHRLQVYSQDGAWRVVQLAGNTDKTLDALVGRGGKTLWVLQEAETGRNRFNLVKYTSA